MNSDLEYKIKYVITLSRVKYENVIKNAQHGVFTTYEREFIIEVIKNFFNAQELYYDDYDPNKVYYTVRFDDRKMDIYFDLENMYHLFGLPRINDLSEFEDIVYCLKNSKNLKHKKTGEFLEFYSEFFKKYEDDIANYDSNEENENKKKINWDKVAIKLFSFLNLGVFSKGQTIAYRDKKRTKKELQEYIFIRFPLSENVDSNNTVRMILIEENLNGKTVLVPKSLQFEQYQEPKQVSSKYKYIPEKVTINQCITQGGNGKYVS